MSGIVILGAGQAGLQLAVSLRELGYDGPVTLLGDEPFMPYQRPPLSKAFLADKVPEAMLFMQEPDYFAKHDIEFCAGETAVSIDRASRQIGLASGRLIAYDHLVFATGARNRLLPCADGNLSGVLSLRTLEDARKAKAAISSAERIVVVGAGFLGLEAATIAAAAGSSVHVVEAGPRVLGRVVTDPVSAVVRRCHEANGVRFDFSEYVTAIHGDNGTVCAVACKNGDRIPADLVLIAIGVLPNDELAAKAGLKTDNGIVVNRQLRTEDPAISAIGDCASFPFAADGGRFVRLESVQNAVDQARCVAERLTGKPTDYDQVPTFWSDQAGLRLQMAGLTRGGQIAVVRGDPEGKAFSVFCYRDDRLVAVESVSRLPDHMLARRLLRAALSPTPDQAADLNFDLKAFVAAKEAA